MGLVGDWSRENYKSNKKFFFISHDFPKKETLPKPL
jgi:hypothetical protein